MILTIKIFQQFFFNQAVGTIKSIRVENNKENKV